MKAAQFSKYGGPEVIEFNPNAALPGLKDGQVLVEGRAASLNPVDTALRAGYMQKMLPLTFPVTLAGDFAGEVKEVGGGVSDLRVGDQVFGFAPVIVGGSGTTAELIAANALMVARRPTSANYTEAATMPLAGVSAVQALEDHMKVRSGQRVLIHGGAGGIGSFAVQYAKYLGCHVATTVRGSQEEFVRKLGADDVVNLELERFDAILKDYDAVLDTVGGEVYKRSFSTLKKGGIVASMVQNPPDQELMSKFGVRSVAITAQLNTATFNHLAELVDKGALKAKIDREYPLEQTREAYTYFEQDHPKGKVAVKIK
jgi:alcohol dehydrogenase